MKVELICFRLTVLVVLGSIFGFGGGWLYMAKEGENWQPLVSQSYERMNKAAAACDNERGSTSSCEFFESFKKSFDRAVAGRDEFHERASLMAALAIAIPLGAAILFYSFRWALTGRITPLLVREDVQEIDRKNGAPNKALEPTA